MLNRIANTCRTHAIALAGGLALLLPATLMPAAPALAQAIESIDPNAAIDADLSAGVSSAPAGTSYVTPAASTATPRYAEPELDLPPETYPAPTTVPVAATTTAQPAVAPTAASPSTTYAHDDLIGAAEGLFGRGAEGLARLIENILDEQGEPNGYIVGREGGGAFIFGVRYGSGTLFHAIEGNRPVYWTGPSIGLDAGANAGNTFVLVYNLDDTEDLYHRFPAGEGQAYFVGGFTASYLRKGNIVLIPIRVGAGLRLGVNAGYMRFSHEQRWLPF